MKRFITLLLSLPLVTPTLAQTGSEIILFDLKEKKNEIVVSRPRNVTNHPGYDNQPSFHSDKPFLYYASFDDQGRSDIKRYDFRKKQTQNITVTPEREYSPTLTPDKNFLSCIIQRDNNAQDLGKYPVDGGEPTVIIDNLTVGYHVWADNSHLAMFVLGDPHTLHFLRLPTKSDTIVAENIGRALHRIPNQRAISFVHKVGEKNWIIKKLDTQTMTISTITQTLPDHEDIAWTPKGQLITSDGTKLFWFDGKSWVPVTIAEGAELLKGVTRLAVSAKGDQLAVVVSE